MATKIELYGKTLVLNEETYQWQSLDKDLEKMVNLIMKPWEGAVGGDPNPFQTISQEVVDYFNEGEDSKANGKVLEVTEIEMVPGMIY